MMNRCQPVIFATVSALIVCGWGLSGHSPLVGSQKAGAQDPVRLSDDTGSSVTDQVRYGDVPESTLLTERGRQLAEELRHLQRSKATLGEKHPSRPAIDEQMESIRRELRTWAATPANVPAEDTRNPFDGTDATPQMNNDDLRLLVLRLIERVERLEQKVTVLERRRP